MKVKCVMGYKCASKDCGHKELHEYSTEPWGVKADGRGGWGACTAPCGNGSKLDGSPQCKSPIQGELYDSV